MFKRPKDDAEDAGDLRPPTADTTSATPSSAETTPAPVEPEPQPEPEPEPEAQPEPRSQADVAPPTSTGSQEVDIHTLLRRLDDVARAAGDSGGTALRRASEDVDEHAEVLSATVSARQEANRLLALATEERDRASADGAAIIEESRAIAARLTHEAQAHAAEAMAEIQRWATGQREQVGDVVSELTTAANREADSIRERAHGEAVAEAQRVAQVYVARAAAIASRDAEQFRTQAADVLGRSAEVVTAAHATMHEFTQSLSTFVTTMGEHLDALQAVVDHAAEVQDSTTELAPISVDPTSWAREGLADVDEADLVVLPLDPHTLTAPLADLVVEVEETESDAAETEDPAAETDEVQEEADAAETDADESADAAEAEQAETEQAEVETETEQAESDAPAAERASRYDAAAGFPEDEERPAARPTARRVPPPPGGRPLGSLFRDPDQS